MNTTLKTTRRSCDELGCCNNNYPRCAGGVPRMPAIEDEAFAGGTPDKSWAGYAVAITLIAGFMAAVIAIHDAWPSFL